jgi:putative SOS response-associated peptidase YedK
MCGRYTLSVPLSNLVDTFDVEPPHFEYVPRFNIAPTQEAPVLARDQAGTRMGLLRWGLIPSWAKEASIGSRLINARSETVAEKPAFRSAFAKRRCLVLADGFFEWTKAEQPEADPVESGPGRRKGKPAKTPHWIHLPSREVFTMAGIWEKWSPPEGEALYTFSILTTEAAPEIRHLHHRMPVILGPESRDTWLDAEADPGNLRSLLGPYAEEAFQAFEVSTLVNSPRNDEPVLIEPVEG